MEKEILTNSSLTAFKTCPRKYEIQYEKGYVPADEGKALSFGKLFHAAIEAWYGAGRGLEQALKVIAEAGETDLNLDSFDIVKAQVLMEGYHATYKDEPYEVVVVEKEYRAPLLNPETSRESQTFSLSGVMDAILKREGRLFIKETKTTSDDISPESDYWRRLVMDSQVSGYYLGAAANGYEIENCLYDVIKKPGLEPYKATPADKRKYTKEGKLYANLRENDETAQEYYDRLKADVFSRPDFYYGRKEVPRSQNDLEEYLSDIWGLADTLRGYRNRGRFPRNTNSCFTVYGKCRFFDFCSGQASIDDTSKFVKSEKKHRELKGAA